jgi:hypothetical protein
MKIKQEGILNFQDIEIEILLDGESIMISECESDDCVRVHASKINELVKGIEQLDRSKTNQSWENIRTLYMNERSGPDQSIFDFMTKNFDVPKLRKS